MLNAARAAIRLVGSIACTFGLAAGGAGFAQARPDVVIVTVDTLRADRMSANGYERPTSPNLDAVLLGGVRFSQARTVEPLTAPSLCSMLTSQYPHEHGTSRNGLRMRQGLESLPTVLKASGYYTAAFVSNWTLKHRISGLGDHFDLYEEVLNRKRWFGLASSEANADDVNGFALNWFRKHKRSDRGTPALLWVHYVEPHAPYRLHKAQLAPLGIDRSDKKKVRPSDRYDTEIRQVDETIGELLDEIRELSPNALVVFASDHGESLGEHNYWGHGRHLYDATLHIPMGLSWPGHLKPMVVDAPSLNIDLAPTILSLLDLETPEAFKGYDWTPVFVGAAPPRDRVTTYQAHKGAVLSRHDSDLARRSGLLAVAVIQRGVKEIFRIQNRRHRRFNLASDPVEHRDLTLPKASPTGDLQDWMRLVYSGLNNLDATPPKPLDEESIEQLRSLGYAD